MQDIGDGDSRPPTYSERLLPTRQQALRQLRFLQDFILSVVGLAGALASIVALWVTLDSGAIERLRELELATLSPGSITSFFERNMGVAITAALCLSLLYGFRRFISYQVRLRRAAFLLWQTHSVLPQMFENMLDIQATSESHIENEEVKNAIRNILDNVRVLFTGYTKDTCAVCIKLKLEDTKGESWVRSYVRDSHSAEARKDIDRNKSTTYQYRISANTAFIEIFRAPEGRTGFLSNNLYRLYLAKKYRNSNTRWRDFYNACMVVAIAPGEPPTVQNSIGFLCVDNIRGGFDRSVAMPILLQFSAIIYTALSPYDLPKKKGRPTERPRSTTEDQSDDANP